MEKNTNCFGSRHGSATTNEKPRTNWFGDDNQNPSTRANWFDDENKAPEKPLMPEGVYICLASGKVGETNKGNPLLKITFKIIEGDFIDEAVWHNVIWTERNKVYRDADLKKLQITCNDEVENYPAGMIFQVAIIQTEYDGKTSNSVDDFRFLRRDEEKKQVHPLAQDVLTDDEVKEVANGSK